MDSRNHPNIVEEGALAVFSTTSHAPTQENRRLYSMVDWYSGDGDLETGELRNFLVIPADSR